MGRCKGRAFIAEITILELASALGHNVRGNRITKVDYATASREFFQDIADGRLEVRRFPSSEYVACRDLLTLVGVDANRNLETQDAIVAHTARLVALEKREKVMLLTSDQKLARVVADIPVFRRLVGSEYLDPN